MALQGPFAVIADTPAPDVVDALRAAGAFPIIETTWADAPSALASVEPEAIVLADACPDAARAAALTDLLGEQRDKGNGLFMPVIARTRDDGAAVDSRCFCHCRQCAGATPGAAVVDGAPYPHAARHGAAPHAHARVARRTAAATADHRSARRSKRACRRARPFLSGPVGRCRRAGRRGRRASGRERGARAPRPRYRRHGDRRRLRPENRRGVIDRARRGPALSRFAGRRFSAAIPR